MSAEAHPRHPIRVVARRTGLTPATIRAWERRYGVVDPGRSEGGHRLYSDLDVERLDTLRQLTELGRSISSVASLPMDRALALLAEDRTHARAPVAVASGNGRAADVNSAYAHLRALDGAALERLLWRSFMALGARTFVESVAAPLLERIGEGWEEGDVTPAHEHLGSAIIDRVLSWMSDPNSHIAQDGPAMVIATLPGERHGLGARLAAATASVEGWRTVYLGTDLPAQDIAGAAAQIGASAVAISVVGSQDLEGMLRSVQELRRALAPRVRIVLGGRSARLLPQEHLPAGIDVVEGLSGLERY